MCHVAQGSQGKCISSNCCGRAISALSQCIAKLNVTMTVAALVTATSCDAAHIEPIQYVMLPKVAKANAAADTYALDFAVHLTSILKNCV